ncbi:MAG: hypothetical protein ACYDBW_04560 [Sulfuricaulis sp.]
MYTTARNSLLILSFIVVAVFYYFLTWSSGLPLLGGDHPVYLLMADHFSFFPGLKPEVSAVAMRYTAFPPFYPLLMGVLGGTSAHVDVAHAITTTFLLAAVLVYFVWLWNETQSVLKAFLLALIFSFLPTTLLESLGILSENLYLLLTLLAIWLVNKPDISLQRLYAIAAVIGLAAITRTIGVTLIGAFVVYLLIHKKEQWMRLVLVSIAPLVLWNILRWILDYKGGYLGLVADIVKRGPLVELITRQISIESHALWVGWIMGLDELPTLMTLIAGSVLGVICLAGTIYRIYMRKLDGIYLLFYFCLLMLWPFSLEAKRFLYAILPIFLFHGLEFCGYMLQRLTLKKIIIFSYPLAIVLVAFPAAGLFFNRMALATHAENRIYENSSDWYSDPNLDSARKIIRSHLMLVRSWRKVSQFVPENDCVYHVDAPSLMLYADRRSYSPPIAFTKKQFLKMANYCHYFYLGSYTRIPYRQVFYPKDLIAGTGKIIFIDRMNDVAGAPILGMLVEIPP